MPRFWVGFACVCAIGSVVHAAPSLSGLDRPVFTATPAELLAAAEAAGPGATRIVLRETFEVTFDGQGRRTRHVHRVIALRGEPGELPLASRQWEWLPRREAQPTVRVRVITTDGQAAEGTVTDRELLPDRHLLTAAAAMSPGAVVEIDETRVTDPLAQGDAFEAIDLGALGETLRSEVTYVAPAALHLRITEPAGLRARRQSTRGLEQWTYEVDHQPARVREPLGDPGWPRLVASSAASWDAVARAYRAVLDHDRGDAVAWPTDLPRTPTLPTARALIAWLHAHVAPAPAVFGDAPLAAPQPPSVTMIAGRGNVIERATLLIALLATVHIPAELVLTQTFDRDQVELDIEPAAPSIAQFDDAVVRARIAGRPVWLDVTDTDFTVGELRSELAGRHGLVIAGGGHGLVSLPGGTAADVVSREVATFVLPESGHGQVTRVLHPGGGYEAWARHQERTQAAAAAKREEAIAHKVFFGKLDHRTHSDVRDLTAPFTETVVITDAGMLPGSPAGSSVAMPRSIALADLLAQLPFHRQASGDIDFAIPARTSDFVWISPATREVEERLVVPSGFSITTEPFERTVALGPASLDERLRIEPADASGNTTAVVTFRATTGKRRFTADETRAAMAGVVDLLTHRLTVQTAPTWRVLQRAGKLREALAEIDRLIALHPSEGSHHGQRAQLLGDLGLGAAAHREARQAVTMSPGEPWVYSILGWALLLDSGGRATTGDWDRDAALAAVTQGAKAFPDNPRLTTALGAVLAIDAAGQPSSDADLRKARALVTAAHAVQPLPENGLELANLQFVTEGFAEAEATARSLAPGLARDRLIVASIGAQRGLDAALQASSTLGGSRAELLRDAGYLLLDLHRYDVARGLIAASGAPLMHRLAADLARLAPHPEVRSGTSDAKLAAIDALLVIMDPRRTTAVYADDDTVREARTAYNAQLTPNQSAGRRRWVADAWQSMPVIVTGDGGVWRVAFGGALGAFTLYLVVDHNVPKVVGGADLPVSLGRYLLRALDGTGPLDPKLAARADQLLDWLRQDSAAKLPIFAWLWTDRLVPTREAMRLAAAGLVGAQDAQRTMPIATRCASTLPNAELACAQTRIDIHVRNQAIAPLLAELDAIERTHPAYAASLFRLRVWALTAAKRFADAERVVNAALAEPATASAGQRGLATLALARGDLPVAIRAADVLASAPTKTVHDTNNAAWFRACARTDLPAAIALARKAVADDPAGPFEKNTLAVAELEAGDLVAGVADLRASLAGPRALVDADWYALGRLADLLGLTDDAIAFYRRIAPNPADPVDACSSWELARARLTALGAKP